MNDNYERYRCQIALPEFGRAAQQRLHEAKVLIVGAGGLGCPAAQYLAAAGIGTICIADNDVVSLSNLHRQILYTPQDVGLPKVEVAAMKLQQQNPLIKIIPYNVRVTSSNVMDLISEFDLVIEGTDNFETKYLLNDACVLSGKPLVYGAIYQYEGQVSVWNVLQKNGAYSPNYRDVFPDEENARMPNCADGGVIPTLAGVVGCMQANEAIKYFTDPENILTGKLWIINMVDGKTHIVKLKKLSESEVKGVNKTVNQLSWEDVKKKIQQDTVELIDVRTKEEHNVFNIGGKNIPLPELSNRLNELNKTRQLLFYCATGNRSANAVRMVNLFSPDLIVFSLRGGIDKMKEDRN